MKRIRAEIRSEYGLIQVEDRDQERYLLVNHEMESCWDLKEGKEVLFPYMRQFSYAFSVNPDIRSVLLIGGGACSYPMFYLRRYPDKTIDVIEINADVLDLSRKYFGLKELEENERFHLYNEDAKVFLQHMDKKYDLIINDAFIGREQQMRTPEDIQLVHDHLTEEGLYLINLVSAIYGPFRRNLKKTEKSLRFYFKNTVYLPCGEYSPYERQNLVLAASDQLLP